MDDEPRHSWGFGRWFRYLRLKRKLSQEELARKIETVTYERYGYSKESIGKWERSERFINHRDRVLLLALVKILAPSLRSANQFLQAGGYSPLDRREAFELFGADPISVEQTYFESMLRELLPELLKEALADLSAVQLSNISPSTSSSTEDEWNHLTSRQQEIVRYLISPEGVNLTNRQVALDLEISHNTLKGHLRDIYRKLNINNRAGLVMLFGPASDKKI